MQEEIIRDFTATHGILILLDWDIFKKNVILLIIIYKHWKLFAYPRELN